MRAKDQKVGTCRLCREEQVLRLSHIFPEFFYRPQYEDGYVETVALERPAIGRLRKGLRERLLCDGCEGLLNRSGEDYASKVFSRKVGKWDVTEQGWQVSGLDYSQFKTFQVSLLWRASVSSIDFFRAVKLGPHEERIRKKLYRRQRFEPTEYGCAMFRLRESRGDLTDLMTAPAQFHRVGVWGYVFLLAGFRWTFIVSRHEVDEETRSVFLQPDGSFKMPFTTVDEFPALARTVARLMKQGKLDEGLGDPSQET